MDNTKPWKVVIVPTALGICKGGIVGQVLHEEEDLFIAKELAYQTNLDADDPSWKLYATVEVIKWIS